ncbi:hypothetical protein LMG29542_08733 [Paraburkholderia humisilvae]|uniref:Uncharacterized protein n=1 Tax=Paraburkholderia humisilvae TaxID=627669 RepID=A0A6J5FC39_9BURK|nr:hypothetical protein LMG29542_08733 [Paraburkholderia humisilvae]
MHEVVTRMTSATLVSPRLKRRMMVSFAASRRNTPPLCISLGRPPRRFPSFGFPCEAAGVVLHDAAAMAEDSPAGQVAGGSEAAP